jgi:ribosomal protein L35
VPSGACTPVPSGIERCMKEEANASLAEAPVSLMGDGRVSRGSAGLSHGGRTRPSQKRASTPQGTDAYLAEARVYATRDGRVSRRSAGLSHGGRWRISQKRASTPQGTVAYLAEAPVSLMGDDGVSRRSGRLRHKGRSRISQRRASTPQGTVAYLAGARVLPIRKTSVTREGAFRMGLNPGSITRETVALLVRSPAAECERISASTSGAGRLRERSFALNVNRKALIRNE